MTDTPARRPGAPRGVPQRSPRFLTDDERQWIIATHGTLSAVEQARQLNMVYDNLCWQRRQLIQAGLISPATRKACRIYTAEENARIAELAQLGYSIPRIARLLKRPYASVVTQITTKLGGIRRLRSQEAAACVRTPTEVGILFSRSQHTVDKWVRLGWLASTRNARHGRIKQVCRLISDEAIQEFLEKRDYWPAWDVAGITDPDWQSYARDVRARAGGDWLQLKTVARQTGLQLGQIGNWWRKGKLGDVRTLSYGTGRGYEHLIWSEDVPALAARMREDPRTGRSWSPARRQAQLGGVR